MSQRYLHPDEFELANRDSIDSRDSFDLDAEDPETQGLTTPIHRKYDLSIWQKLQLFARKLRPPASRRNSRAPGRLRTQLPSRRLSLRRICFLFHGSIFTVAVFIILTSILRPSYTNPPPRYQALRQRALTSKEPGRVNIANEKIFIAASIFDPTGELAEGAWADAVLGLVDLLGPDNVFLSVYENDAGTKAKNALGVMEQRVDCDHKLLFEDHLDPETLHHVILPGGVSKVKRIEYLAEVRNRALRPLEDSDVKYDKVLYLNDVIFDPIDAAQLLFSTNAGDTSKTEPNYRAACAVDFINAFKFYDTFATRDVEGYSMGVPFYPWFTDAGSGQSRREVLNQKEAVMVKSCWGGMVAFDAKYFQFEFADKLNTLADPKTAPSTGFRFRAEQDLYWEASECCLIHADIQNPDHEDTGIYVNPYVRVAYDVRTHSWLGITRRFERLYSPIHWMANHLVGLPWNNPRRTEKPGQEEKERVWVPDEKSGGGSFKTVKRKASHAAFCGSRTLQVMRDNPGTGQKPYEVLPLPP